MSTFSTLLLTQNSGPVKWALFLSWRITIGRRRTGLPHSHLTESSTKRRN